MTFFDQKKTEHEKDDVFRPTKYEKMTFFDQIRRKKNSFHSNIRCNTIKHPKMCHLVKFHGNYAELYGNHSKLP